MVAPNALAGAAKPDSGLSVDPAAPGTGLRAWLDGATPGRSARAAAFDTRIDAAPLLTGRASRGIAHRLRRRGYQLVAPPESFLVDKAGALLAGELVRARAWGAELAEALRPAGTTRPFDPGSTFGGSLASGR